MSLYKSARFLYATCMTSSACKTKAHRSTHNWTNRTGAIILLISSIGLAQDGDRQNGDNAATPQTESRSLRADRVTRLIDSLNHESWMVREQSTRMLGNPNEGFELDMLAEVLEQPDLPGETRLRLQSAARELFTQTTKAGLGVGFGAMRNGGVEIGTVVDDIVGFPAAAMLIPGDLIIGADGAALTTSEDLRATILSHAPGERMSLLIQRADQVLDLDVPLGSYSSLRGAAPINQWVADQAIQIRWERKGFIMPSSIQMGESITAEDWVQAGYPDGQQPADSRMAPSSRRSPRMINGGSADDAFVGTGIMIRGRIEPWKNLGTATEAIRRARRIELSTEINDTRIARQLAQNQLDALQQLGDGATQDGLDAQQLKIDISKVSAKIQTIQRELEAQLAEFEALSAELDQP